MSVQQLFQAGRLDDAIQALNAEVRDNPTDAKRRTFLFELLCFSGDFARAEKQLDILEAKGAMQKWAPCSITRRFTQSVRGTISSARKSIPLRKTRQARGKSR